MKWRSYDIDGILFDCRHDDLRRGRSRYDGRQTPCCGGDLQSDGPLHPERGSLLAGHDCGVLQAGFDPLAGQ